MKLDCVKKIQILKTNLFSYLEMCILQMIKDQKLNRKSIKS